MRYRDILHASERLPGTYVIRLFAEFETGLRSYWDQVRGTNPRTHDLLVRVAAMRVIPDEQRAKAQAIQNYRNSLVHEREEEVDAIPVSEARGHLCRFFSFLPPEW